MASRNIAAIRTKTLDISIMALCFILLTTVLAIMQTTFGHVTHKFHDVQDRAHLQQHLHHSMDAGEVVEEELRFHYFHAHDTDGNQKLDGLEILQAFTHYHNVGEPASNKVDDTVYSDLSLITAIDPLLDPAIDKNQDGCLDYAEFIHAEEVLKDT